MGFNSRPRMGGDWCGAAYAVVLGVSTHAPAWGATVEKRDPVVRYLFQLTPPHGGRLERRGVFHVVLVVSTHAPAWGATLDFAASGYRDRFQLTPPHGGRRHATPSWMVLIVSTHAPAWGATYQVRLRRAVLTFQLTPPHGGRPGATSTSEYPGSFQLTPPHGGRPFGRWWFPWRTRFNSRPRMGGDHRHTVKGHDRLVSTHAPAWGATMTSMRISNCL